MTSEEFMKKLSVLPEEEPDEIDLAMLKDAEEINDESCVPLDVFREGQEEESEKVVLRIPHSLHTSLKEAADREGISFSQYVLYKLAR